MAMTDADIREIEQYAYSAEETLMSRYAGRLVMEVRSLKHELADPNYLYVGRIPRGAILCRDAEIGRLRKEIAELKGGTKP